MSSDQSSNTLKSANVLPNIKIIDNCRDNAFPVV